jgi:hypothetical protein
MPNSRYANRRSPEDQQRWNAEKADSEVHRAPECVALRENPAFDPRVCGDCQQRDCKCTCPDCGVPSYRRCDSCREMQAPDALRSVGAL